MGKRAGNGADVTDGSRKRGRKDLRNIRRARNDKKEPVQEPEAPKISEEEGKFSDDSKENIEETPELDDSNERAYGALLTILKSEHPEHEQKERRKKRQDVQNLSSSDGEHSEDERGEVEANLVDTPGEEEPQSEEEFSESEEEESEDEQDPFESHFNMDSKHIDSLDEAWKRKEVVHRSGKLRIDDNESLIYTKPLINKEQEFELPSHKGSLGLYLLKKKLKIQNNLLDSKDSGLTPLQKKIVDPLFQYKDLLYEYEDHEQDEDQYRDIYVLHLLNHIYKTRDRILKDNQRITSNPDVEFLDQGFTRPKVLIVAPTRDTAYHIVSKIIEKSGLDQVDKKSKLNDQFFEEVLPPSSKPKSFRHIFKGNTNDFFVLGVKFTRKAIRLYSNFYQSDLIVCSPLGLQLILENTDRKKRQDDFLSSIELMVIDQLNSIEFQNISHLFTVFDHMNKIPKEQHDTDFGRVRMWYINDQAKLLRQTLIFTRYITPTANFLLNGKCRNIEGRWRNHHQIPGEQSSISKLGFRVRQIFQRVDLGGASVVDEPDYRFRFFTSVIVPGILKSTGYEDGILLYIPDYADFIRVRNYLKERTTILFGDINEYSDVRQLTSTRSLFQQGRVKVLLYTERLHHFRRYEIKGVKSVIFYQPPSNPEFYNEVVRYIGKSAFLGDTDLNISTVRCVYSRLDGLALERIVSSKRAAVLTHGQNEIYEFK